jgi:malonyl-CoA O-methyltransferase
VTLHTMSESFDVNAYWSERGRHYNAESRLAGGYHKLQESFLVDVLKLARVPMQRVLEIGCGFGRVTKVLAESFPDAAITAVDLSSHQLEKARLHCMDCHNVKFASYDFYSGLPLPDENYDAVIAVEVFLHHREPHDRRAPHCEH